MAAVEAVLSICSRYFEKNIVKVKKIGAKIASK
jgi:hypothetical protein